MSSQQRWLLSSSEVRLNLLQAENLKFYMFAETRAADEHPAVYAKSHSLHFTSPIFYQ